MTQILQRLSLLLLLCSLLIVHAHGLPLSSFFSYGPTAGDHQLARTNGAFSPVSMQAPFWFYGRSYSTVYVHANGVITFDNLTSALPEESFPNRTASIAPFWTAVDQQSSPDSGNIYYRVTNDGNVTYNISNIVRDSFGSDPMVEFTPSQMLIVTWDRVKGVNTDRTNTFQCILASNENNESYVFFLYSDSSMEWPGSPYALVGLNAGDGVHHLTIPTSQSEAVLNIAQTSNGQGSDVWVFRTDASDIIQPGAIVGLDQSSYEVNEGDGSFTVCVILYDGVPSSDTDIQLNIRRRRGGTAERGVDFTADSRPVTFSTSSSGNSDSPDSTRHEKCLDYDITDDDILEDDETYLISVGLQSTNLNIPVTILPHTTLVTIMDDDTVGIEPFTSPQTVEEGNPDAQQVCFTVLGDTEIDFTYFFTLSPHTALVGEDYTTAGTNVDLTVSAGDTRSCFSVALLNDNIYKTDKSFYYSLGSRDDHVTIEGALRGEVRIADNDEQAVIIGFEHSEYTVLESESVTACVWMTGAQIGQPFTATIYTAHTSTINRVVVAEAGIDFGHVRQEVTFFPNETLRTKKCITVQTYDDQVYEGVEQYGLHFYRLGKDFTEQNSPARLYIRDNDEIEVTVDNSVYNVDEQSTVRICASHSGSIEGTIYLNLDVFPGTADVGGGIYSDINLHSINQDNFLFSAFFHTSCISIFILSDSTFENEFESFTVSVSPRVPDPELIHVVNASAEVIIRDLDQVRVRFEDGTRTVYESQSQFRRRVNPCVKIVGFSAVDIPISLSDSGGDATDGYDYNLRGGDIQFNADKEQGEATDCQGLTVQIHDDPVVEGREQVQIRLVSPDQRRILVDRFTNSQPTTSVFIEDDDVAYVSFVAQLLSVSEGAGGVDVCLQMRGFSEIELSANIATFQDSALENIDFQPQSVQLTFPPTNQSILDDLYQLPVAQQLNAPLPVSSPQCSRVAILDDDILEEVDSKLLGLRLSMGGTHVQFETPSTTYITIMDDDAVTLEVTEPEVLVNEGDGVARVCARMIGMADFPISARFTTADDSAQSPDDYNSSPHQIVFPARSSSPQCADIPLVDDNIVEFREYFDVILSTVTPHIRVRIGENNTATVTIEDNDFVNIGFVQEEFSTVERSSPVTVCAELNGILSIPVSVSLATTEGSGSATAGVDYIPVTNVSFFNELGIHRDCVDIVILDDSVLEDSESFEVALSSPDETVHFTRPTANVYVLDDDGVRMGLEEREYSGYEGEEIEICVELVGMFSQSIPVTIQSVSGSARGGADYESFSESFQFDPLAAINEQRVCHNLTLLDDSLLEDQESLTITMQVNHPGVSIHIQQTTVIIVDNDEVTLSFRSSSATAQDIRIVSEDVGNVEVCVDLDGSTEKAIEYSVVAQPGTAQVSEDYRFVGGNFVFLPSTMPLQYRCFNVSILDDLSFESTEQLSVNLSTNVSRVNLITTSILIEIRDNDTITVGLNQTDFAIVEELQSGGVSFTVCTVLTGRLEKTVVVHLSSQPISSAANEQDYNSVNEFLTFEPLEASEQSICHPVVVHDDREVEGAEFFKLLLTTSDPAVFLNPASATVTITEGDVVCVANALDSSRGYFEWPQTYPSETAKIPCKEGGAATRVCSISGRWENPNLSNCQVSAAKLFKYLMMNPFTEENFAELLYAVQLLEDSRDPVFETEYMFVVLSYFEQFNTKVSIENKTITLELLETTLRVIDGVQKWPGNVVQMYSSRFMRYAEDLISAYVAATDTTSFERGLKYSSFFFEKGDSKTVLPNDKPKTVQYTKDSTSGSYVRVPESVNADSSALRSSITLPPSLGTLLTINDNSSSSSNVGMIFSMYETGVMFPIAEGNGARRNETNVSSVISATVLGRAVQNLKDNITYTIYFGENARNLSGVICVSWDFNAADGRGNWTSKGCSNQTDGSGGNVTCSCNHLTNFAVLVDTRPKPVEAPLSVDVESTLSVISIIGVAVSILGLLLTIITLLAFKKLRQRDSTVLRIQFCISVILMLLSFVAGVRQVGLFAVCVTVSALIHYFTLVSLMWMAAEALLIFQKAIISTNVNYKYFIIVSLICWLLPIPAVVVPIGLNRDFVTHDEFCFISHGIVFYAAFLGPIAAILIFNLLIFLAVVCVVIRHSSQRYKNTQKHSKRKGIVLTMLNIIAVLVLFGLTWLFGAFTVNQNIVPIGNTELFEFLFVVCNSLQGFYVFIFFVVLAKETRQLWLETCGCRKKKEDLPDIDVESIPGTPSVSRVPSLRRPVRPSFNIDEYGKRLEQLTVDTPDTRKRMNSWDIMYVMPQNQFHILFSGSHEVQQQQQQLPEQREQEQEEDIEKELELPLPQDGGELGLDQDNRSTADSGIMDDKAKSTPSPILGRPRDVELAHPQPGGTPHHVHSVSGVGYISDEESAEDDATNGKLNKQTKSHDQSRDSIELGGHSASRHSLDVVETSKV